MPNLTPPLPTYRYQPGDRPLDGFTLRAPAGRGGFGEVYFAESDAGREVALKALYVSQGYDEIELRGIRHCMNLKSPHLVSIFDVKTGHDGTPFVIMEYVAGPSLRDLLNDSPQGLGTDKAAFFLREVAKGLSHLHGYGVVHRDLKPANIFYEDGYVKIGDYGLSKLMSANPVASQTITVGTVHYMAPEIGAGKYDKSIDLYALGCLLYEMLTGRVPYSGGSPTEVLMKHLQAEPELDDVPETFARVIKKALQKDPADRYVSATEMVEDLFGADHVRNSVSQLNADELSSIARRVGRTVPKPELGSPPVPTPVPVPAAGSTTPSPPIPPAPPAAPSQSGSFAPIRLPWPEYPGRRYLVIVAVTALLASLITSLSADQPGPAFFASFFLLVTLGPAALLAIREGMKSVAHRATTAGYLFAFHVAIATVAVFIIAAHGGSGEWILVKPLVCIILLSFIINAGVDWPTYAHPDRPYAFSPGLWLAVSFIAGLPVLFLWPRMAATAFAMPVITAVGAQLMSPLRSAPTPSPLSATPAASPSDPSAPAHEGLSTASAIILITVILAIFTAILVGVLA